MAVFLAWKERAIMDELKMSFDDMISSLDGASGRLTVESLKNPVVREAKEMVMKVSISLGEWAQDMKNNATTEQ